MKCRPLAPFQSWACSAFTATKATLHRPTLPGPVPDAPSGLGIAVNRDTHRDQSPWRAAWSRVHADCLEALIARFKQHLNRRSDAEASFEQAVVEPFAAARKYLAQRLTLPSQQNASNVRSVQLASFDGLVGVDPAANGQDR
jgi:hypothetical protein